MGSTPFYGFPYPEPTDPVANGAADIRALAESIEAHGSTPVFYNRWNCVSDHAFTGTQPGTVYTFQATAPPWATHAQLGVKFSGVSVYGSDNVQHCNVHLAVLCDATLGQERNFTAFAAGWTSGAWHEVFTLGGAPGSAHTFGIQGRKPTGETRPGGFNFGAYAAVDFTVQWSKGVGT